MPELPEVETTLRAIKKFKGSLLKEAKVHNRNLRWKVVDSFETSVKDQVVESLERRAKYIIFKLSNDKKIILHLGMSGSLRIAKNNENFFIKHDHVELIFDEERIIYNDPRRFGSMHLTSDIDKHKLIKNLGPEPLSKNFNAKDFFSGCSHSKTNIKSYLMNQKNVVGIGNIYASESLFLAKIHPLKNANELDLDACKRLVAAGKKILEQAIEVGGTTLKDFYSADGSPGYFKFKLNVYGREGEPCNKCKDTVCKTTINQRATFFCETCQS